MLRVFITGSSDGLGSLAAQRLVRHGHQVMLHARNPRRAQDALAACPGAVGCLVGDLSDRAQTLALAHEINQKGPFDVVVHNAGLYTGGYRRTKEGWPSIFAVNTLAPYMLSCLVKPLPLRHVFISTVFPNDCDPSLHDLTWQARGAADFPDIQAYCDTKLHVCLMAAALARRWPSVRANSLDPGWVATKLGGWNATGDLNAGIATYLTLIEGKGDTEAVSGQYWRHSEVQPLPIPEVGDVTLQERLLSELEQITSLRVPAEGEVKGQPASH
ncbi:short-chain dehydrogenase [Aspergillus japonicus CBS 114.51]|uniref:Short-chain dehydrogenase n=1 Tax=Aspergillus japonicus CBS 114.51 TaxID=1448312 RepID=A0A8T8WKF9_ASPJA|nr:short-chain dehydrogenase [Aspergillus japonicus CBS 114.51]RAH76348.1 short-chain dehydrogenase [Aspergillus japonicus CBS 114.51]